MVYSEYITVTIDGDLTATMVWQLMLCGLGELLFDLGLVYSGDAEAAGWRDDSAPCGYEP